LHKAILPHKLYTRHDEDINSLSTFQKGGTCMYGSMLPIYFCYVKIVQ